MSLFNCEKCGVVENTALCGYNFRGDGPALCSKCDPKIGKWHNCFVEVYRKIADDEPNSASFHGKVKA